MHLSHFKLSETQLEAFGAELDALEQRTRAKLGAEDTEYIRRIVRLARNFDLSGRMLLLASFFPPAWFAGTSLLGVAKILDNMEIGHNVMHGQFDFMRDPVLNTKFEWDCVSDADQWRHSHNYVHHTFTNVLGYDHDIGYRLLRTSEEQPWHPLRLLNLPGTIGLAFAFEWGVGLHDVNAADAVLELSPEKLEWDKLRTFYKKVKRMVVKDYVLHPLLAGPMAPAVLLGNLTAKVMRNTWAWAVIFCGHFPEETQVFTEDCLEGETRGHWYLRQILGSANIEGGRLMHLMTGHLSHQIEHHLFPTIPAWRYPEMATEVKAICEKYGIPYNAGSFGRQIGSVMKEIARLSLPVSREDALGFLANAKKTRALKARGSARIQGKNRDAPSAPESAPRSRLASVAQIPREAVRRASRSWRPAAA
jgi:NADPH-dependent stearoyl-CoA 9-desaturase